MATITTITYNLAATTITWTTLSSFASTLLVGTSGAAVDNATTNKYVDAMTTYKVIMPAGIPVGPLWFGFGVSTDGVPNYGNPYLGTDSATISILRPPQFPTNFIPGPGGSLYYPASQIFYATMVDTSSFGASSTYYVSIPSVASCLGSPNVLPQRWGPWMLNHSGQTTAAACTATYTGITYTNA